MLGKNQGNNQTVQGQGLTENKHNQHTDIKLVGTFCRWLVGLHSVCHVVIVSIHVSTSTPVPFTAVLCLDTVSADTRVTQYSNRSSGSETGKSTTKTSGQLLQKEWELNNNEWTIVLPNPIPNEMPGSPRNTHVHITIVRRILVRRVLRRHRNSLRDNNTDNETINTQNTRHDDGYNVTNDTSGVIYTHVTNAQTGTPGAPGRTPWRQNHANGGTHVSAVDVFWENLIFVVDGLWLVDIHEGENKGSAMKKSFWITAKWKGMIPNVRNAQQRPAPSKVIWNAW